MKRVVEWLAGLAYLAAISCSPTGAVGKCGPEQCPASSHASNAPNLTPPATCSGGGFVLQRQRLDIALLVDDSASMLLWWTQTIDALQQFFSDQASANIGVGLQFFGESCDPATYAQPAVPIGALPGNLNALRAAFPLAPLQDSPTKPALQGMIMYARGWALAHPDRKVVTLLVTDGVPEECDSTVDNVSQVARDGFETQPSIQTFVVVFGLLDAFSELSQAGGTDAAVSVESAATTQIFDALVDVRDAARSCQFFLPVDRSVDLTHDQFQWTRGDGTQTQFSALKDAAACDTQPNGFYVDDPGAPKRLIACPDNCSSVGLDDELQLLSNCG